MKQYQNIEHQSSWQALCRSMKPLGSVAVSHGRPSIVALSREHGLGPLLLNLPRFFRCRILICNDGFCRRDSGNQRKTLGAIIDLIACDFKLA
ncbi:hypothetical protein GII23_13210 [Stutzerimonas balearica]|nr:hypothetical protein [Stutzerimonas balearica]QIJ00964.1 hypothetical protein GII23_13210 [Stutzerimonas balearica]